MLVSIPCLGAKVDVLSHVSLLFQAGYSNGTVDPGLGRIIYERQGVSPGEGRRRKQMVCEGEVQSGVRCRECVNLAITTTFSHRNSFLSRMPTTTSTMTSPSTKATKCHSTWPLTRGDDLFRLS